jgi:glycosyltransferase involved in cell wall biosynthesis
MHSILEKLMYIYNDMNKPIVSVIIPTYNRERFVTKAIDSVLQQRFNNYEIIVIDDGSTDNTKENLKRYGDKIIYFYQENSGVSSALNAGINVAKGDWIAILGSDDEWMPNYLSQQIDSLIRNPTICMQTANCLFIDLNGDTRSYFEINGSMSEFNGQDYLFLQEPSQFDVRKISTEIWNLRQIKKTNFL